MAVSKFVNGRIRGIVTVVPGAPIRVEDLPVMFSREDIPKIARSAGLGQLHRATANQTASDLNLEAARILLKNLAWEPDSVDALINVTQTPDCFSPATACILHGKLGLSTSCLAFDVNIACSGYVYGLLLAWQFVSSGTARRVLLTVGDTLGKTVAAGDRSTAILFGDAGSATALEYESGAGEIVFVTGTDGAGSADLCIPAGGWRWPIDDAAVTTTNDEGGNARAPRNIYMDGLAVFNFTLARVPELIRRVVTEGGCTLGDIDKFYLHQANAFILKTIAAKIGIPRDKVPVNIDKYGNTSMASIPLLLTDDLTRSHLGSGMERVVLAGFGAGYSWAAMCGSIGEIHAIEHVEMGASV